MYGKLGCLLFLAATLLSPCVSVIQLTATPTESYFFSPNFPQKYGNKMEQAWLVTASDPSHVIHLEVVDSEIEASSTCMFDYVQVHDGQTSEDPVIGRFCGKDVPSYVTSGRSVYVSFSSDDYGRYMGFYIRYYSSAPSATTHHASSSPESPASPLSTVTTFVIPYTTAVGESRAGQTGLTGSSLVGILIAVAFCLIVFVTIATSVCLHNSNKVHVQPKNRPKVNEDEVWQKIFSPKPRKPIPFNQESDLSSRSTTSTNIFNTSTTSGFSSGAPCSPSTLHPVIAQQHLTNHHYHALSPVPEASRSGIYDETDDRCASLSSQKQYAYLDMMELSPRRLQPLRVSNNASNITSPRNNKFISNVPKVYFASETSGSDVTSTPRSDQASAGLSSALKKAREARRERYKQSKKTGDEFERGHAHTKHSLINRIDLVRCGVLSGEGTGVPRIDNEDATRKPRHSEKSFFLSASQ